MRATDGCRRTGIASAPVAACSEGGVRRGLHETQNCHRWMLELGALVMRTETELILKSRRVVPGRMLEAGFEFRYPTLDRALEALA